jgi:imidazole glycerol phosphate synthase subunit HisF
VPTRSSFWVPPQRKRDEKQLSDIEQLLEAGISKISINTAAVHTLDFIAKAAEAFGRNTIIVAMNIFDRCGILHSRMT